MKYIYTATVKRGGRPVLLSEDELVGLQGFRSVFGYTIPTTTRIEAAGHTRKLHGAEMYIDCLVVDFDNCKEDADRFGQLLRDRKIAYAEYDSGNRSQHYHVEVRPRTGHALPRDAKHWVQLHAPGADLTVYTPTGLFRLPGTWHEKNPGRRKELIIRHDGGKLSLPPVTAARVPGRQDVDAKVANRKLQIGLSTRKAEGGRRCFAYYLAKNAQIAGYDEGAALRFVAAWNLNCASPQLDMADVELKVGEAYEEYE